MESLLFTIEARRYAIRLAHVAEVLPAVNVQPLSGAPSIVEGAVNVRGEILPVLSLRARLGHPARAVRATEYFILVNARARRAILRSDTTPVIVSLPDVSNQGDEGVDHALSGVLPMADGLVFFHDMDEFIDADELGALTSALSALQPSA
ncbi:MAG: cheW7 [Gemmatimonadetes bacterium]|nr:cheW7 [Gemmatimonadota bacterium]